MAHGYGAVSRRALVTGGAIGVVVAALSGCQGQRWHPSDISPDEYVLRGAITTKNRLIDRYETLIADGTGPENLLEQLLTDHRRHLAALKGRMPDRENDPPDHTDPSPSPSPVPEGDESDLSVAGIRAAEQSAAAARPREARRVADPALSQLLTSIGASEAGHVQRLTEEG